MGDHNHNALDESNILDYIAALQRRTDKTKSHAEALVNDLNASQRTALRVMLLTAVGHKSLILALGIFQCCPKPADCSNCEHRTTEKRRQLAAEGRTAELFK